MPEKCTEKLVDLVFVLATKLDLNVNDMRELLDNSMKENCQKFEELAGRLREEVGHLSEKISRLEEENRGQNERLLTLETEARLAAAKHGGLEADFTSLRDDYNSLVVEEYGARLTSLEGGQRDLYQKFSEQNKENIERFGETISRIENTEIQLVRQMEDTGKSLESAWNKKDEENKAELAESGAGPPAGSPEDLALPPPSDLALARPAQTAGRTEGDSEREIELLAGGPGGASAREQNRRRLYLNVGRPRPFYGVSQPPLQQAQQDQQNTTATATSSQNKTKVRLSLVLLPTH